MPGRGRRLRYTNWLRRSWYPATIAAGLGQVVEDQATGRRRYEGPGFHDLRRASATGLVAAGVDVKTAQSVLGHTDARVTLDLYAQVVTEQQAAADAMAARFLDPAPRDGRGMDAASTGTDVRGRTRREGLRPGPLSPVGWGRFELPTSASRTNRHPAHQAIYDPPSPTWEPE
jgi:Phage integrase family